MMKKPYFLPYFAMGLTLLLTIGFFTAKHISISKQCDTTSNHIRIIEQECEKLKEEIKSQTATKDRLSNAEVLRNNAALEQNRLKEPEKIIRVETSRAFRSGKNLNTAGTSDIRPKDLAVELGELAVLSHH